MNTAGAFGLLAAALATVSVELQVPAGSTLSRHSASGPDGSVVALLVPQVWDGSAQDIRDLMRIGAFDRRGRLLWDAAAPGVLEVRQMFMQRDGAVLIWGHHVEKVGRAPSASMLFRFGRIGLDRSLHTLAPEDLGDGRLTSVTLAADGTIELAGTFTSIRGQPRAGRARLRPDGSLDD